MGAKKFGMFLEGRKIKFFWRDIPGFCWDIPAAPEKFEKKKFVFNFWPLAKPVCWIFEINGSNIGPSGFHSKEAENADQKMRKMEDAAHWL